METITVGLEDRSYPIYIGTSLDCGSLIRDALPKVKDLMVVTNETVGPLYFDALKVQRLCRFCLSARYSFCSDPNHTACHG